MNEDPHRLAALNPDEVHIMIRHKIVNMAAIVSDETPLMLNRRADYRGDRDRLRELMTEIDTLLKRADEIVGETPGQT